MLPFSTDAFFALFEEYNRAIWPAQIVAYALGLAVLWLVLKPPRESGRMIAAVLAVFWLWTGIVYHLMFFADINFLAPLFTIFFVLQGLLFVWTGAIKGKVAYRFAADLTGWTGIGLMLFAMVVYPVLGWIAGHGWPRAPVFGVAPCPMTIFTIGALLLAKDRTPLHLLIIPVLWALVGGTAAWILDVPEDLFLKAAGLGGFALVLVKNRRAAKSQ